jgi:molybdate transport system substrate-binding protein
MSPPWRTRRRAGGALAGLMAAVLALVHAPPTVSADEPPVIAAAADLQFALEEVSQAFTQETGQAVKLANGSSGNFTRQIRQGAPFQLFLSADEQYVLELARDGLTRDEGVLYAVGRIALIVPKGSPLQVDGTLEDLRRAAADGRLTHLAIANPEHAPYGKRAEEALRHVGLWDALQGRLVLGENVAQATQLATSGSAQGGIVAYSLANSPRLAQLASYALIPAEWHQPLNQRMVLLAGAGPVATRFYAFTQAPPARAILRRHGFVLPGEQS